MQWFERSVRLWRRKHAPAGILGPSPLVLCFLAGVPLFRRRPSASVGFIVGFRRCLSVFFGFVGVIRPVCVFLAGVPCFLAGVLLFPSALVGFPRCYSARHFGVFCPGLGIYARCSVFLLGFCCSFFKAGFLSVGFLPASVGIPPAFR